MSDKLSEDITTSVNEFYDVLGINPDIANVIVTGFVQALFAKIKALKESNEVLIREIGDLKTALLSKNSGSAN